MTMFQKRHYQAIARLMQDLCPELPKTAEGEYDNTGYDHDALGRQLMWGDMVDQLSLRFWQDNPSFKSGLFKQACQPGANVRARKVA